MENKKWKIALNIATIVIMGASFPQQTYANEGKPEITQTPFKVSTDIKSLKRELKAVNHDIKETKKIMLAYQKDIKDDEELLRDDDRDREKVKAQLAGAKRSLAEQKRENKRGKTAKGEPLSSSARARNERSIPKLKNEIKAHKDDLKNFAAIEKSDKAKLRETKRELKKIRQEHKNLIAKRDRIQNKIDNF